MALLTFNKMFSLKAVQFQVYTTTALSHLMKMGETGSREMTVLAVKKESSLFLKTTYECHFNLCVYLAYVFCLFFYVVLVRWF